jgi:2-polyprenyl-3-methyl-5-hydroxy-6-metoxy-1,4-benzoquinol methylase
MRAIDIAGFEKKFRAEIDPWNYTHSKFEQFKRLTLLRACGPSKRARILELGCAIGETSRRLGRISLRLLAVDGSRTALAEAVRRTPHSGHITFRYAKLPEQMPRGQFDVIVVSELIYYLRQHQLKSLADRLISALAPGGMMVILNHRGPFDDAAVLPELAHRRLRLCLFRRLCLVRDASYRHFNILVFRKPVGRQHP